MLPAGVWAQADQPLSPRATGELDIHHIDTGRGNTTLIVGPDGTLIMIDAGASLSAPATSSAARPDASLRPGQWAGRYARQYGDAVDIFVATHIHPDHIGDASDAMPISADGSYRLSGVSDVAGELPIRRLIDRDFPDYGDRPPPDAPFTRNYLAYLRARRTGGEAVETFEVGSNAQIGLNRSLAFPTFSVRNLAANGRVWSGQGKAVRDYLAGRPTGTPVDENVCSVALKLSYGAFSYFAGGDLIADTHDGRAPWRDIETPVARLAGRTEAAAANHHGYFDACGPAFVEALDAQVYVIQAWHATHPGQAQLQRMLGAWEGRTTADVFATDLLQANRDLNGRFVPQMKSTQGHVVIRVAADGASYRVFVLDSTQLPSPVKAVFGPYRCRTV
ncbi:ComEC/Rec2 family competence protein [Asticcacaulis sp. AND118]|uniref:ComEC/Rec2 family competence protein n=1 Tax=Asticcacaulis sp. AND118 TaxID=2840468 RepID=UPI001CFFE43E|nr:MBL fold metallo-hydrolase [Asticcacaulis sp. AND118]UDF05429.1 MBL fold metallo-hydrolase [Asticcacaulis sp. AND118]